MTNIFNIQQDYLGLMREIEEVEGELTPELEERLKINEEELEQKVKAYHHVIQHAKADVVVIDEEIARLNKIKQSKEGLQTRLKDVLLQTTLLFGYDGKTGNKKIDYDTLKLYTVNSESIMIRDEESFNDERFTRLQISLKLTDDEFVKVADTLGQPLERNKIILKSELKAFIKTGEVVDGTTIVKNPYIRIS